jgi:hypothetical protein
MTNLCERLADINKLAMTLEYGCLNILISEKLNTLVKEGLLLRFEIKDDHVYIDLDAYTKWTNYNESG